MELKTLEHFVKKDVEILVGGVWIEGHMMPIVKGVVTLIPIGPAKDFYGPTACQAEVIQAVRQVKRQPTINEGTVNSNSAPPAAIRSGLESTPTTNHPGNRFVHPVQR